MLMRELSLILTERLNARGVMDNLSLYIAKRD